MTTLRWSYTSGASNKPLLGVTIGDLFDRVVSELPSREALVSRHQKLRYTYADLAQEVSRAARGLLALGVIKGDRVGIWSPTNAEWVVTQFATAKIGAILVNINPSYRREELRYALEQSGVDVLVMAPGFKGSDYTEMIEALEPQLKAIVRLTDEARSGMYTWADLMGLGAKTSEADLRARQRELEFDDPINIQYTSGTTGFPKGATLSHHNILNNGYFVAELMRFTERDRLVVPVPLYHCFGMVMGNLGCLTHGATLIYPGESFEPLAVFQAVQEERATALYGVPTMFIAELSHPEFSRFDLRTLRTGVMAGSPCPIEVMKKVVTEMHMTEVEICYGMTETSPVSFQTRPDAPLEKRVSTVGQVHPHVEVKIVDPETGGVKPLGEPGELLTRGYSVMLGYWGNESATRAAVDRARWMHTGDLAVMDDEGYVKIVGRIKDMVIRGGENVYPREIEEFLYRHPKIQDAQVIGVPDEKYGEEVMAWIKLREGESATVEEIREFCRGEIAHFKIPRYVKFVDAFPMTVTGKIQKYLMREQSIKELGLERAASSETA